MKTRPARLSRRNFILAVGAGTAASAAAIVAQDKPDSSRKDRAASESAKGYQLTEHVRNYYRTAKI